MNKYFKGWMAYGFIAVLLVMTLIACSGKKNSESDFQVEPLYGGKSVQITKYVGDKWEVNIPSQIRKLPVTHIGRGAFDEKKLTSVTIPNSVTTIERYAFSYNQLTKINIPKSVTYIGDYAFAGNPLINVTIGANVELDEGEESDAFDRSLVELYIKNGKSAGTYTRPNTNSETWTKK